jgi:hypothetical protein
VLIKTSFIEKREIVRREDSPAIRALNLPGFYIEVRVIDAVTAASVF